MELFLCLLKKYKGKKVGCFLRIIKVFIEITWFSVLFGLFFSFLFNFLFCYKVVKKRNIGVFN